MRMLPDPGSDPDLDLDAPLARTHPVAKLAVATIIGGCLLLTVDLVTAGGCLLWEVGALAWCGVRPRALVRRCWPVVLGATTAGAAALIFGQGPPSSALSMALRIVAIGLPGVVLLTTTDPTDLADGLVQVLRLPERFTLAGLAALRLFAVFAEDLRLLRLARRARGLGPWPDNWRDRLLIGRLAWSQVFGLLVLAIRRATILAAAMEARGFGSDQPRTWARQSRLRRADGAVILTALMLTGAVVGTSCWLGTWNFSLT